MEIERFCMGMNRQQSCLITMQQWREAPVRDLPTAPPGQSAWETDESSYHPLICKTDISLHKWSEHGFLPQNSALVLLNDFPSLGPVDLIPGLPSDAIVRIKGLVMPWWCAVVTTLHFPAGAQVQLLGWEPGSLLAVQPKKKKRNQGTSFLEDGRCFYTLIIRPSFPLTSYPSLFLSPWNSPFKSSPAEKFYTSPLF